MLQCEFNWLTSLDINKNTKLTTLTCGTNQISELDVSALLNLERLECECCQLTSLDVSSNTKLRDLACYENRISELNVTANPALESLSCFKNQLTTLDMNQNTKLKHLYCYNNHLASLELSNNPALEDAFIGEQTISETAAKMLPDGGGYALNFNELVPGMDLSRVTMTDGGTLDTETGIVSYSARPVTVSYTYRTNVPAGTPGNAAELSVSWKAVYDGEAPVLSGDLDGDGELTSADVVLLARYLAGAETLTEAQLTAADLNADGVITSADLVLLARKVAWLE